MRTRFGAIRPRVGSRRARGALLGVALLAVVGCSGPTASPSASPTAAPFADRPAVSIDGTWTAQNGQWTFTGTVDPQGNATDVVLEVGPGPQTLREFDAQVPVSQGVLDAGPVTITTSQIPDIPEICVRFSATNAVGTSVSQPLCVPHDIPTLAPPGSPTIRVDSVAPATNGQWSISAYVDPMHAATDAVLDIGTGPASSPSYTKHVPLATGMSDPASLQVAFDLPAGAAEVCVRVTATNSVGTTSSDPTCFSPAAPS
jgi:hypothetical protein